MVGTKTAPVLVQPQVCLTICTVQCKWLQVQCLHLCQVSHVGKWSLPSFLTSRDTLQLDLLRGGVRVASGEDGGLPHLIFSFLVLVKEVPVNAWNLHRVSFWVVASSIEVQALMTATITVWHQIYVYHLRDRKLNLKSADSSVSPIIIQAGRLSRQQNWTPELRPPTSHSLTLMSR